LQRKVFKPLILFHDQETIDTPARNRRLSLIEEHKIKTKDMLDYNALLWEDEGRPYCSTPKPCSSGTKERKIFQRHSLIFVYLHRSITIYQESAIDTL
jgi:hypothetical protein